MTEKSLNSFFREKIKQLSVDLRFAKGETVYYKDEVSILDEFYSKISQRINYSIYLFVSITSKIKCNFCKCNYGSKRSQFLALTATFLRKITNKCLLLV